MVFCVVCTDGTNSLPPFQYNSCDLYRMAGHSELPDDGHIGGRNTLQDTQWLDYVKTLLYIFWYWYWYWGYNHCILHGIWTIHCQQVRKVLCSVDHASRHNCV